MVPSPDGQAISVVSFGIFEISVPTKSFGKIESGIVVSDVLQELTIGLANFLESV